MNDEEFENDAAACPANDLWICKATKEECKRERCPIIYWLGSLNCFKGKSND